LNGLALLTASYFPWLRFGCACVCFKVGTASRAAALAAHFDGAGGKDPKGRSIPGVFFHESSRGFTTYTGTVQGVGVSVVAIGMGTAMMDFLVRELRSVVQGPMLMVRFGTCGGLQAEVPEGTVVVAERGSVLVLRDPDAFHVDPGAESTDSAGSAGGCGGGGYRISKPALPDPDFSAAVLQALKAELPNTGAVAGLNATADSFYASQGRIDSHFDDRSDDLLELLKREHPSVCSMEMESFQLLHLANCSKGTIKAAATAIVVANRPTGKVMDGETLSFVESNGGKAVLRAIAAHPLG